MRNFLKPIFSKQNFIVIFLLILQLSFLNCLGQSTSTNSATNTTTELEVDYGSSSSGTIAGNPTNIRQLTGGIDEATIDVIYERCEFDNDKEIFLQALNADKDIEETVLKSQFTLNLSTTDSYTFQFTQDDSSCGNLTYASGTIFPGYNVVLGHGTQDVDFGKVTLNNKYFFSSEKNVSTLSDQDQDGISDDQDVDSNGDGVVDFDSNLNGIEDWHEDIENPEDSVIACGITYVSPHKKSIAYMHNDEFHRFIIYVSDRVKDYDTSKVKIYEHETPLEDWVDEDNIRLSPKGPAITLNTKSLTSGKNYLLEISPGFVNCENGNSNTRTLQIKFFAAYPQKVIKKNKKKDS